LRAVAALAATVAAARVAVGVDLVPWRLYDPGSGFGLANAFSTMGTRFGHGFSDFYGTHLPFDPRVHAAMGELVLSGVFTFALAVALFAAERKPIPSALALLLGAGWPATLLGPSYGIAMGAAILGAALIVLAGLGRTRLTALALPAVVVVAAGAVAVGSATAARHGLVHWQSWNLTHVATGGQVGVSFVWDARYGGLRWPKHPTEVLQVQADETPSYLRAAVLDDFSGDAWSIGPPRPADSLEPAAALRQQNQTPEIVTVTGLADTRLVGGSIPVRFAAGSAPLSQPQRGFASLSQNLPRGFQYTAWSYDPKPTPAELRRSAPEYPAVLSRDGLLDVGRGVSLPPFGSPDRTGAVQTLLAASPDLYPYRPLARVADEVAGGARTPYDAVERLESWFISTGGFHYSNRPFVLNPPLVGFVTQTREGYCQYFAGAMTLMLRYLGIPARVAVGFAGGTYAPRRRAWVVTDREAHAWVEVWFKGYGWLPFDPTPAAPGAAPRPHPAGAPATRGVGSAPYPGAPKFTPGGGSGAIADKLSRQNGLRRPHARVTSPTPRLTSAGGGEDRSLPALLLLLVLAAAAGAIALAKTGLRISRGLRRDPRSIAAACREELAAFLVDQRIEPPRSATLTELGELVRHEFGADPDPFVAVATAARYGRADAAEAAARRTRRELRALLDGVRKSLTRRERLRGLLSLRSLARRAAPVDASASLGTGMATGS
ncbi:MAG TPA: transglutaminaseTgpA domain-containing protein, partial [Gaiellaceae bacterium]|nr:transglutaminaseTgpA domain-containing protein [Gaiellaceae bacterium]